jgi:uroporphyrinogen-III synthase
LALTTPLDLAKWTALPFYVVGKATARALSAIGDVHGSSHLTPLDIRGGPESGTSERLAYFILEDLRGRESTLQAKLLHLTGDKNRDTLPRVLTEGGVQLDCLQVYETQGSSTFATDLQAIVNAANPGD